MPVELADSYESIYKQALTQMAMGNTDEAIESMLRIVSRLRRFRLETLQRKPSLYEMLVNASEGAVEFLRWEKRYDEAISVWESVWDLLPDPIERRSKVASLMIEKGEAQEGLARLRQIGDEHPGFSSSVNLAIEYVALKRYKEAETCYQSALAQAESNEEAALANVGLLRVYKETDRVDQALDAWNMAVVLDAGLNESVEQIYTWLIQRGDLAEAKEYVEREHDSVRYRFYAGLLDWEGGNQEAATQAWKDVLEMDVDQQDTNVATWMEAALRLDRPAEALERAETLPPQNRARARVAMLAGVAHAMLGQIGEAKQLFAQVTAGLQRQWPSQEKIPADEWAFMTSLVTDQKALQDLVVYFEPEQSKG